MPCRHASSINTQLVIRVHVRVLMYVALLYMCVFIVCVTLIEIPGYVMVTTKKPILTAKFFCRDAVSDDENIFRAEK